MRYEILALILSFSLIISLQPVLLSSYYLHQYGIGTSNQVVTNVEPISQRSEEKLIAFSEYISHEPIVIEGDSDFVSQGWQGNGTPEDPYIIEGILINIAGGGCIKIYNTTLHFIIRDCILTGGGGEYPSADVVEFIEIIYGTIMNCTIQVHGGYAVHVRSSTDCSIISNNVNGNTHPGIIVTDSYECIIENNSISKCELVIRVTGSQNVVAGNILTGPSRGLRIDMQNNIVEDNMFLHCGVEIEGNGPWTTVFENNTVNGLPLGVFCNLNDSSISGWGYGQLILANCKDVTVNGGSFNDCSIGVQIHSSMRCVIEDFIASRNGWGVDVVDSVNCTLRNGSLIHNNARYQEPTEYDLSVYLFGMTSGCHLFRSSGSLVENCTISHSEYGVYLRPSSWCNITQNKIYANRVGIKISDYYGNAIGNTIWSNLLCQGQQPNMLPDWYGFEQRNGEDGTPSNSWDNGTRGNSWNDYSGTGTYTVPGGGGNEDHFPQVFNDPYLPLLDHPEDILYNEMSTLLHSVTWKPSDEYPGSYQILLNGSRVSYDMWPGGPISFQLVDLPVGIHNFTLIVCDASGNVASDTVMVTCASFINTSSSTTTNSQDEGGFTIALIGFGVMGSIALVLILIQRKRS